VRGTNAESAVSVIRRLFVLRLFQALEKTHFFSLLKAVSQRADLTHCEKRLAFEGHYRHL